ncbi:hypothetical protein BC828DRAFT_376481 [Blastocladiella britannica]|nr:hypothetical protein BC828DRAFT_376481 [Blastocladiella britannica]
MHVAAPGAGHYYPLSDSELAARAAAARTAARAARLAAVRSADHALARTRRSAYSAAYRSAEAAAMAEQRQRVAAALLTRPPVPSSLAGVRHAVAGASLCVDPTTGSAPIGRAHSAAAAYRESMVAGQLQAVARATRAESAIVARARTAAATEEARRATPIAVAAARTAAAASARATANARSVSAARRHTPAPALVPVVVDVRSGEADQQQNPTTVSAGGRAPASAIVVHYTDSRLHAALPASALRVSAQSLMLLAARAVPSAAVAATAADGPIADPNGRAQRYGSASDHAIEDETLAISRTAKAAARDAARTARARARGDLAMAKLRADRDQAGLLAALDTARALDWDRRRTMAAPDPDTMRPRFHGGGERARVRDFEAAFPDVAAAVRAEVGHANGDVDGDEDVTADWILQQEREAVARARSRPPPLAAPAVSPTRSSPIKPLPVKVSPPSPVKTARPAPIPPARLRARSPTNAAPPTDPSRPPRTTLRIRVPTPPAVSTTTTPPPASKSKAPSEKKQQRQQPTAPTPRLPTPIIVPSKKALAPAAPLPKKRLAPTLSPAFTTPDLSDATLSLLRLLSSRSDDPLLTDLTEPSNLIGGGTSNTGLLWDESTWGTTTMDEMIDELGSLLSAG